MDFCPVLIGRDEEVATLGALVTAGSGCALVSGEAGIGKSRLLRECADIAKGVGRPIVWGRPESITRPGPYSLIFDLLDGIATERSQGSAEAAELSNELAQLLDQPEPPARQVAARIRGFLCVSHPPAVAVVEDLHLADELSLAVFAHLVRAAVDDGFLVVGSFRPDAGASLAFDRFLDVVTRERLATTIQLGPLGRDGLRDMLNAMWHRPPRDEELLRLEEQAEGIPFFIEELASSSENVTAGIPASISRAVSGRLRLLPEASQRAIRLGALFGPIVDTDVLSRISGLPQTELVQALRDSVRSGILTEEGDRVLFRHSLVRQAIAETSTHLERAEGHKRIAHELMESFEAGRDVSQEEIGGHLFAAGQGAAAGDYWLRGGERALSLGAIEEARRLFSAVLENPHAQHQDARAIYGMGLVLYRSGDIEAAANWLRQASAVYLGEGKKEDAAKTLWRLASLKALIDPQEACGILDEALAFTDAASVTATRVQIMVRKGYVLVRLAQDFDRGGPLLRAGLQHAEELGADLLRAEAHEALAFVAEELGERDEADSHGVAATRLVSGTDDREAIFRVSASEATRFAVRGRCDEALTVLADTAEQALAGFGTLHVASVNHIRAWIHWLKGEPAEADRFAARVEATNFAGIYGRIVRIWASLERGEEWVGRAIVENWWDEIGGEGFREYCLNEVPELPDVATQVALGELVFHSMLPAPAEPSVFDLAVRFERVCRMGRPDNVGLAASLRGRLLLIADKFDEAQSALSVFDENLKTRDHPLRFAAAREILGLVEVGRDRLDRAAEYLSDAVDLFRGASNSSDQARCLRLWAKVHLANGGKSDAAIAALKQARELALNAGALVQLNMTEAALRGLGSRPRAGRPKGSGTPAGMLSAREEEIAVLIAGGATNAEIARKLFLSTKTVENHISRAQRRLSVTGRAGLAAWAAKHGLV